MSLQEERKSFAVTYERSHWRKVISLYKTETTKEENKVVIIYKEIISYIFLYAKMGIHVMLLVLNVSIESTRKSYANSYIQTQRCKYHYFYLDSEYFNYFPYKTYPSTFRNKIGTYNLLCILLLNRKFSLCPQANVHVSYYMDKQSLLILFFTLLFNHIEIILKMYICISYVAEKLKNITKTMHILLYIDAYKTSDALYVSIRPQRVAYANSYKQTFTKSLMLSSYIYYKSPALYRRAHLGSNAYVISYKQTFFNNVLNLQIINGVLPCLKGILVFYIFQTLQIIYQQYLGTYLKLFRGCQKLIYDKTILLNLYFAVYNRIIFFIDEYFLISKYFRTLLHLSKYDLVSYQEGETIFQNIVSNTVYLNLLIYNVYIKKTTSYFIQKLLLYPKWI